MLAQKPQKNKKFKFENYSADFIWETTPDNLAQTSDENYGKLLRNIYNFDPSLHEFDKDRFTIDDK